MKKIIFLFTLFCLLLSNSSKASHFAGGNIYYDHISGNQYRIWMEITLDCGGASASSSLSMVITNTCSLANPTLSLTMNSAMTMDVSQVCPSQRTNTRCFSGTIPGRKRYLYSGLVTLPSCNTWKIGWSSCCRNSSVVNTTSSSFYTETTINSATKSNNTSVRYTGRQNPYVCINQPAFYNFGAFDPDGDSLSYQLVSGLQSAGTNVLYSTGYSGTNPINTGFSINSTNGTISFTPNSLGSFVVDVKVTEWNSSGQVVGTTIRDIQIVVINCLTNIPPNPNFSIYGATGAGTISGPKKITSCSSGAFCFNFQISDTNSTDSLNVWSTNMTSVLPGATLTYTGANPITATLCWTIPTGFSGSRNVSFIVTDDACPIPAQSGFSITVEVQNINTTVSPDVTICEGNSTTLVATGGAVFNWSTLSGPTISVGNNFSCSPCSSPSASPVATTKYVVTSNLTGGCINKDTVEVTVIPGINIGNDTAFCDSGTVTYTAQMRTGMTYLWNNLNTTNSITTSTAGTYIVTGTYPTNSCVFKDTAIVIIDTIPSSNAGIDFNECITSSVNLNGNPVYPREYGTWSQLSGPNTAGKSTGNASTPLTGLIAGTYNFQWNVTNNVCPIERDTVQLTIHPIPTSNAGIDVTLCDPDSTTLNGNTLTAIQNGVWSQISGPTTVSFSNNTLNSSKVYNLKHGVYILEWKVDNAFCDSVTDIMQITIDTIPEPNAGIDFEGCITDSYNLDADSVFGIEIGMWSQLSGPNSATITSSDAKSSVTGFVAGTYTFVWAVNNTTCPIERDTVQLTIHPLPISIVMADTMVCEATPINIRGNTPRTSETGFWSNISTNPTIATFVNANSANTRITNLALGEYKFVWKITSPFCDSATDTLKVTFVTISNAFAGFDDTLCANIPFVLDADSVYGIETGTWKQLDVNPIVIYSNINDAKANVTNYFTGTYEFQWQVSNAVCKNTYDTVLITVYEAPKANAGTKIVYCDTNSASLSSLFNHIQNYHTFKWKYNPGGSSVTSLPVIISPNSENTVVNNLSIGIYSFVLEVGNAHCVTVYDTVEVWIVEKPMINFIGDRLSICKTECVNFSSLTTLTDPAGSVITSYLWNFENSNTATGNTSFHCYPDTGLFNVGLTIGTSFGCVSTFVKQNYIQVNPLPIPGFTNSPKNPKPWEQVFIEDLSKEAVSYVYSSRNGQTSVRPDPIFRFSDTGIYWVKQFITNRFGCVDSIVLDVEVLGEVSVITPNTFTPNGDGVNETFKPIQFSVDEDQYEFLIFSQTGELLYETHDQKDSWDGNFKSVLSKTGVYVWSVKYKELNGYEVFVKRGYVTLLK